MRSDDIRRTFLDFFQRLGHHRVPSASLVPDDPSLLLTGAGMVPFKPYFLGDRVPEHPRLMSRQRCVRTVDIDNVGHTTRHATSFEMLGSFAFGDYGRSEAIAWAWQLLTDGFGLDPDRLWITVYRDDDESPRLWRGVGVPDERIQRLGMADNYWSMSGPGPCGPNTEIFYDRGEGFGPGGGPAVNTERFLELWNLVFMEYERGEGDGKEDFPILGPLPGRHVDTGMGLDRMALVLQDVRHLCETDLLAPTLTRLQQLSGGDYASLGERTQVSYRVVVDHVRAAAFLIADGVLPSTDGRGYVLRRLLRRAMRHARQLGVDGPVLGELAGTVVDTSGPAWPRLEAARELIGQVVTREEQSFGRTLRRGMHLLYRALDGATGQLPGAVAFELHDSHGFPVDLTAEIAAEAGLLLDRTEFDRLMDEQRRRSQLARH
ncbi:alanine--tRNA ligase [Catellatospora sp. KI3]|uniref:alanine--tRNA ligase n=1 Tax=Catellatospora sp. KI3 TaxID=3041620 RepID=UPI002482BFB4|nr:alanine--tRNA ligase [Catellatospora sp. KI3]MDI1460618.1 alanine--tRNA ligase [Catellatospora sp. KI3]